MNALLLAAPCLFALTIRADFTFTPLPPSGTAAISSGGVFTATGGIVALPPVLLSGAAYELISESWSIITTLDTAPKLNVTLEGATVRLNWIALTEFQLQEISADWSSWKDVSATPQSGPDGTSLQITAAGTNRFFRLTRTGP